MRLCVYKVVGGVAYHLKTKLPILADGRIEGDSRGGEVQGRFAGREGDSRR